MDKTIPTLGLAIEGDVERFADITPKILAMKGHVGTNFKSEVKIAPREKYPFTITGGTMKIGKDIGFELTPDGKKGYVLTVENKKMEKGRYYDYISLKTDSKIRPEIRISVRGNVFDPNDPNKDKNAKQQNFLELIRKAQENKKNNPVKSGEASVQNKENINNFLKMVEEQQKKNKAKE